VNRPYYLYRPSQVLRRLQSMLPSSHRDRIVLPWGLRIDFDPGELLGRTLERNGVYELAVSEFLFRLADRGELAVDVGANIGYMSSVLAASVGPQGEVRSFEPHPELFRRLTLNARAWEHETNVVTVEAAVSDRDGTCLLAIPDGFARNMGLATVAPSGAGIEIRCVRLDTSLAGERVGVLKIDAEGHEPQVLEGVRRMLSDHAIRDVVFEEHHGYPSRSSDTLESFGYTVFGIEQGVRGPRAVEPVAAKTSVHGAAQNYAATVDPERLRHRIQRPGWRVLRRR